MGRVCHRHNPIASGKGALPGVVGQGPKGLTTSPIESVHRHSGACRNPEQTGIPNRRTTKKNDKAKTNTKSLDSGIRRNDEQNQIRRGSRKKNAYRRDRSRPVPTTNANPPALDFFNNSLRGDFRGSSNRPGCAPLACSGDLPLKKRARDADEGVRFVHEDVVVRARDDGGLHLGNLLAHPFEGI